MKRMGIVLLMMTALIFLQMANVFAEARAIYIGDEIRLEIHDATLTETEITSAFDGFRVVAIEPVTSGYKVTVSPLKTGQQEILLKDQKIRIDVKSTLDDIQRDSIFEKELETGSYLKRSWVLIGIGISGLVAVVSNGIWAVGLVRKRKHVMASPYEVFTEAIDQPGTKDKHFLGHMTKASKVYLSSRLGHPLVGLTTSQLMAVQYENRTDEVLNNAYFGWLKVCDDLKFKGHTVEDDVVLRMRDQLQEIVADMEAFFVEEENRSVVKDAV